MNEDNSPESTKGEPPKSIQDFAKAAASANGLSTGFGDIKRCRLSDAEKALVRDDVSKVPNRTYTGQPMAKTADVPSRNARVKVKAAKSLIDPAEIMPDKLENAICDVAANEAEMPVLESPAEQASIQDGRHRIMAADELGYEEIEVSYPVAHEEQLKRQLGDDFRPCEPA